MPPTSAEISASISRRLLTVIDSRQNERSGWAETITAFRRHLWLCEVSIGTRRESNMLGRLHVLQDQIDNVITFGRNSITVSELQALRSLFGPEGAEISDESLCSDRDASLLAVEGGAE